MSEFYVPAFKSATVRREGSRVMLIKDGATLLDLPWDAAKELAKVMRLQAARAEQTANVEAVIADQAVLIRKGFPISLTPNPEVFKEAGNEAAHNRDLRRYVPGGVPSGMTFGMARLIGHAPKKRSIGAVGIPSGSRLGAIGGRA
jgi:hypothetical protein